MASQITQGCSGCLIEAIERRDEVSLRNLLSAANVEYSDTCWVPRAQLFGFKASFPNSFERFPVLLLTSTSQCAHRVVEETLLSGEPENIAMSVVLVSMLHTTAEFNAFQIIVESRKFNMNEPLIFHLRQIYTEWRLIIVDPAGMALLLENGTDIDDPNSFLLLKTLVFSCCPPHLETDLQAIEVFNTNPGNTINWRVSRGRGAICFLYNFSYGSLLTRIRLSDSQSVELLALLKALCRLGLCLKPRVDLCAGRYMSFIKAFS